MLHREFTVQTPQGLRSRPAAELAQVATRFQSQIMIETENKKVNAKSIVGLLSLMLKQGDVFHLFITGADEKQAMEALQEVLDKKEVSSS